MITELLLLEKSFIRDVKEKTELTFSYGASKFKVIENEAYTDKEKRFKYTFLYYVDEYGFLIPIKSWTNTVLAKVVDDTKEYLSKHEYILPTSISKKLYPIPNRLHDYDLESLNLE